MITLGMLFDFRKAKNTLLAAHVFTLFTSLATSRMFGLGTAVTGVVAGSLASHIFPNVRLKQLRFKTLVVKFPREAYKMLYFYLQLPLLVIPHPPSFNTILLVRKLLSHILK